MQAFEYKVVPAPAKGTKAKGIKGPEGRFANSIEITLNEMAADGWEYQRAELLPSDERSGLTGSTTKWRNVLIFRRAMPEEMSPSEVAELEEGAAMIANLDPTPLPDQPPLTATAGDPEAPLGATPVPGAGAAKMQADDGVEELSPVAGMTAALKARAKLRTSDD